VSDAASEHSEALELLGMGHLGLEILDLVEGGEKRASKHADRNGGADGARKQRTDVGRGKAGENQTAICEAAQKAAGAAERRRKRKTCRRSASRADLLPE